MRRRQRFRSRPWVVGGAAVVVVAAGGGVAVAEFADEPVIAQVLSITDFHGALEPPKPDEGGEILGDDGEKITVGGASFLATHIAQLRADNPNTILTSTGDHFAGANYTPDVFQDEPNVEVMNALGLDLSSVGNHELDVSTSFLLDHAQNGECFGEPGVDSCFTDSTGQRFHGADYPMSTANLVHADSSEPIAPPYLVQQVTGPDGTEIPVGFINLSPDDMENGPSSYQTDLATQDPIETANRYAAELTEQGVNAIVLNAHLGADTVGGHSAPYNGCDLESGPLIDVAAQASSDIDAIIGGHEHTRFNCSLPDPDGVPRPVLEAGRFGDVIGAIDLALDPGTGEVVRDATSGTNLPNTRDVPEDPAMKQIVDYWTAAGDAKYSEPLAEITDDFTRDPSPAGESTMGDLAADANQWLAERDGGADLSLVATNVSTGSDSITHDLMYEPGDHPGDAPGVVLAGEAWKEGYGYGDPILTVSVTGAQIDAALEQQWTPDHFAPLAVSKNVSYRFDDSKPIGDRVSPGDVVINGEPLDPDATYRLATMSYTAMGSDGFPALADFTDPVRLQPADHEMFCAYLAEQGTLTPAPTDRVTKLN